MERARSVVENWGVFGGIHEKNLADEIRQLEKQRTAIMMQKCRSANGSVICPKPRNRHFRQHEDHDESKIPTEFSDFIMSKHVSETITDNNNTLSNSVTTQASPPYFSGSPPIRTSNPIVQDAHFCGEGTDQSLTSHCSAQ